MELKRPRNESHVSLQTSVPKGDSKEFSSSSGGGARVVNIDPEVSRCNFDQSFSQCKSNSAKRDVADDPVKPIQSARPSTSSSESRAKGKAPSHFAGAETEPVRKTAFENLL